MGEALARPEHRREGLTESRGFTMGQTKVVELGEVERPQGLEQGLWIVDRTEAQSRFELVDLAAEQSELEANRVGVRLVFDKQIENRNELGLPLVARAIGDDNVAYFEECAQRCFALLRRPRQDLGNHRCNGRHTLHSASHHQEPPGIVSRHIVERIARKSGAGGQYLIENG